MSGVINNALQDSLDVLQRETNDLFEEMAQWQLHNTDLIVGGSPSQGQLQLVQLQETFTQLYQLVMSLKRQSTTGVNFDLNNKTLDLNQVRALVVPFSTSNTVIQGIQGGENSFSVKMKDLIAKYTLVALYHIALTKLLKYTLPVNEELLYWELISSATWRKLLYAFQTTPLRLTNLVKSVISDISSTTENFALPTNLTSESTWELMKHYSTLIYNSLYQNLLANNIRGFYTFVGSRPSWKLRQTPVQYARIILGAPLVSVFEETDRKKRETLDLQSQNAKKLGALLTSIPSLSSMDAACLIDKAQFVLSTISGVDDREEEDILKIMNDALEQLAMQTKFRKYELDTISRPSFLTRYWPSLCLTLLYGPSTVISIITNRYAILEFIKTNLVDTMFGFWQNWILKPVNDILSTIRHDDSSEISIMSQNSLDSDLESLKRMVIEYTVDNTPDYKHFSGAELTNLKEQLNRMVSTGDLTPMMKGYEQDIKTPLKNLVSGRLPRALLIQLQKTKVDGAVAMSGIDKLLKSQELVFGIVAASPSLIILIYLSDAINSYLQKGYLTSRSSDYKLQASKNLNNIERLLSSSKDSEGEELDYINGMLLLEIISLRNSGLFIVPKVRRSEWIRDVNDLANNKLSIRHRLDTVTRIYHVHGRFF